LTGSTGRLRLLTVCTHNRTRSVMMAALLGRALDDRLGAGAVEIRSSGFGPVGLPAIDEAVAAMARRGLDVSAHRSSATERTGVDATDLILTAERDHVVRVASLSPAAFGRAVTLPEFLQRVVDAPPADGDVTDWVRAMTNGRTAREYLQHRVPEVADPTGTFGRPFEQAAAQLEAQCTQAADVLARLVGGRD
jgi:protein-tyrosine-phosphatase